MNFNMQEQGPSTKTPEIVGLGQEATVSYLESHNVHPLDVSRWQPGDCVLWVVDDTLKHVVKFNGHISSLARIDHPTQINDFRNLGPNRGITMGNGGQVDYYAILADGQIVYVRSSAKNKTYIVTPGHLFEPNDELFPKVSVGKIKLANGGEILPDER